MPVQMPVPLETPAGSGGSGITPENLAMARELGDLLKEKQRRHAERRMSSFVPNVKQREAMDSDERTVAVFGGNRSGKSEVGGFITACHATGLYPKDWKGRRFHKPPNIWVAGIAGKTLIDGVQKKLIGDLYSAFGTGFLPKDLILDTQIFPGVPGALGVIYVRHVPTGGIAKITLKTMESGAAKFMADEVDFIWLDEEKEGDGYEIYSQCRVRTMTTRGQVLLTFTPEHGMSDLCTYLLEEAPLKPDSRVKVIVMSWEDATHLTQEQKEEETARMRDWEKEARIYGRPAVKYGLIYPFAESEIMVDPFPVPTYWPHVIGMDVARTGYYAAVLLAIDPRTEVAYVISEYKKDRATREEHAEAIKKWGAGIYVAIDPSSNQGEADGTKTIKVLKEIGLNVHNAKNKVEGPFAGIQTVFDRFTGGKLKIFKTCRELDAERRQYQYKDGKIRKVRDHLMDCLRYGVMDIGAARPLSYFRQEWLNKTRGTYDRNEWRPGDARVGY